MSISIQVVSMSPVLGDKPGNIRKMRQSIRSDADLAVFPEMCLTGYSIRDDVRWMAEGLDGPSVEAVRRMADETGTHIVFGMAEKEEEDGDIYNSAVLVAPGGRVWCYRKHHPVHFGPFEEKLYFAQGRTLEVAETSIGKIGMTVCYDIFFPEIVKSLALMGADVVAHIVASPHTTRVFFQKVLPARAIESTVFMAFSNNAGVYNNMLFWGGSMVLDPRGNVAASMDIFREGSVQAEIDFRDLEFARSMRPTLADTPASFLGWMGGQDAERKS